MSAAPHIPVLLDEVLDALAIAPGETHVDGTFGAGGYSSAMAQAGARVFAFAPFRYLGKISFSLYCLHYPTLHYYAWARSAPAAAAELARELFPAPFELADEACKAVATTIAEGLGKVFELAPPPLNVALAPLGRLEVAHERLRHRLRGSRCNGHTNGMLQRLHAVKILHGA